MKIVITGAGGGHFYPLIAVAERVQKEAFIQKIVQPEIYFFSDKPAGKGNRKSSFDPQKRFASVLNL